MAPQAGGDQRYGSVTGYGAVLVLPVVVFTVYRFCNVDDRLFAGSPIRILLNALDGAVPGLFVCVGFLIFQPLVHAVVNGRAPVSGRRTLSHLAVLVLPLYYLVVLVAWLSRQSRLPGDWVDLVEHLTFTQVFDPRRIFYTVGPAWAVSVAVLSVVAVVGALTWVDGYRQQHGCPRPRRIAILGGLIGLMVLLSVGWRAWFFGVHHDTPNGSFPIWYGPIANADVFAVALALALVVAVRRRSPPLTLAGRVLLRVAGIGVLVGAALARDHHAWVTVYFATASAIGFGLLLAAEALGPEHGDPWSRALRGRAPQRVAGLSLAIYLWHEPVMLALRRVGLVRQASDAFSRDLLLVSLVTFAVSWATYVAVQVPAVQLAALSARE